MRTSAWIRNLGAASLLLPNALALAGCYTGLGGDQNSGGQDGAGEDADDDAGEAGSADDDGTAGDDGPPV
ncbi:MAG TPA: hypothetical protein VFG69_00530, partial [Nannocystaceae bacterium]|nr:hypothetical protein [Nannocystaceae bacterium]